MTTAIELCDMITAAHRQIAGLSGDGGESIEANFDQIEPLAATVRAAAGQLVQTPAATLAGWRAKAAVLLLTGHDDDLATSLATGLALAA